MVVEVGIAIVIDLAMVAVRVDESWRWMEWWLKLKRVE
jgi:hypothetical protein